MTKAHDNRDQDVVNKLQFKTLRMLTLRHQVKYLEKQCSRLQDVSRHLAVQLEEYRQIKDEWEWFFQHSLEMLCITDINGHFKRVNPAFANNLGYSVEQLINRPFFDFVHPGDRLKTQAEFEALKHGTDSVSFENRYQDIAGNWHWLSWHCPGLDPAVNKIFAIAHDVTEQKRSESEILYKALHDPLTDLFNRAALEERIDNAISRIKRHPGNELALYMIDLDGFKSVNDSYGHQAGDQLLKTLATAFKMIQRESEFVCRFGGDEFAWLAEGAGKVITEPLAERIMQVIHQPVRLHQATVQIGCCIGISVFPDYAPDADSLISQADAAMYSVKKSGKDGYKTFSYG